MPHRCVENDDGSFYMFFDPSIEVVIDGRVTETERMMIKKIEEEDEE